MPPQLAAEIEVFRAKDQVIEVIEDGARYLVVFTEFELPDGRYSPGATDLMVMADYQYPMSRLDMYWTDPAIRLVHGAYPQGAGTVRGSWGSTLAAVELALPGMGSKPAQSAHPS